MTDLKSPRIPGKNIGASFNAGKIHSNEKAKEIYGNLLPAAPFEIGVQEYNIDATTI